MSGMEIADFQKLIDRMYSAKDRARGSAKTFLWLIEEIGELASALAADGKADKANEFADVFAWLTTLANVEGVDLNQAIEKYAHGCPGCGKMVCSCDAKP